MSRTKNLTNNFLISILVGTTNFLIDKFGIREIYNFGKLDLYVTYGV